MISYTLDCTCGPGTRTEPAKDCPVHSSTLCIKQGYVTEEAYSKLESQLTAATERERVLLFERDAAIEVIRKNFGYDGVEQTLKKARAALAQKGG